MIRYSYLGEGVEFFILPSPICLKSKNFAIKLLFNKVLKVMKFLKNFRLVFDQIDPREFIEVIDKTHIIFLSAYCFNSRSPNIRENEL